MTDTLITDAEVEAVARRYCVLMGVDPDEWDSYKFCEEWRKCRHIARQHIAMTRAMRDCGVAK